MTKRLQALFAAAGIGVLALLVRILPLWSGAPYIAYVDEGNYLHPAFEALRNSQWHPSSYLYPQLPIVGAVAAMEITDRAFRAFRGRSLSEEVPNVLELYDEMEPFEFLLAARIVVVGLSLATVVLTGLLARRLGGSRAGLAAAALAALAPALVLRSSTATVDPWATLFVTAALLLTDVSRTSGRAGLASFGAGAMAACAFASKYPAVLVFVAFVVTTLVDAFPVRERMRRLLLALAGLVCAAPVAMPALLMHSQEVLEGIAEQGRQYARLTSPSLLHQVFVRAEWDHPYEHPEMGIAFVLFAAAGLALGLKSKRTAPTVCGWIAFAAVSLALFGSRPFQPFRNLLPLVPLACVGASLFYLALSERLRRPRMVAAAGLLWIAVAFGFPIIRFDLDRARQVDSRVQALDWLAAHGTPGDTGIAIRELGILRQELRRLPVWTGPRWSRLTTEAVATHRPRWLIAGWMDRTDDRTAQVLEDPFIQATYAVRFRAGNRPTPADRGSWRGNDQFVYVLERRE